MHVLLEEHCAHMAEDLATTGARAWSLNEKTYKPALATMEQIPPTSSLSRSSPATQAMYPARTSKWRGLMCMICLNQEISARKNLE